MATNPMLDAVLRWHHQQTTSPYMPHPSTPAAAQAEAVEDVEVAVPPADMAKPLEEKKAPVEEVEEEDAESNGEDEEEEETEEEGEEESDG